MPKADLLQMTRRCLLHISHWMSTGYRGPNEPHDTILCIIFLWNLPRCMFLFSIKVHTSVREHLLHFSGWNRLVGEISSGGASDPVYWWGRWFRTSSIWYTWTNFIGGPRYFGGVSILVQLIGPMLLVSATKFKFKWAYYVDILV